MNHQAAITLRVLAVVFCLAAIGGSFVLSFSTWVEIGKLAGFGALAVAMPLCVDGHVMTALTTWLSPVNERLARFAQVNLYCIGAASVIAQSAYHAVITWRAAASEALTLLALGAGAFPPVVATMAAHLAVLSAREAFDLATSERPATQPQTAESSPLPLLGDLSPALAVPLSKRSSPEAVSRPAEKPAPLSEAGLSVGLSAVPRLSRQRPPATHPQPSKRGVTVDDVRALAGLERAEIARRLKTSVATVDRRLRELRDLDRQAVPA